MTFPMVREAPAHIVRGLRDIDETAEMLWWGPRPVTTELPDGQELTTTAPVWLVGTVRHNQITRKAAAEYLSRKRQVTTAEADLDNWRYWRLVWQGFRAVTFWPARDPAWDAVMDFQKRDWLFRNANREEERRALHETGSDAPLLARQAAMQDVARSELPGIWRFAMRGRRSFLVPRARAS